MCGLLLLLSYVLDAACALCCCCCCCGIVVVVGLDDVVVGNGVHWCCVCVVCVCGLSKENLRHLHNPSVTVVEIWSTLYVTTALITST